MQSKMDAKAGKDANRHMDPRYTILICMGTGVKRKRGRNLLGGVSIKRKTMILSW